MIKNFDCEAANEHYSLGMSCLMALLVITSTFMLFVFLNAI